MVGQASEGVGESGGDRSGVVGVVGYIGYANDPRVV